MKKLTSVLLASAMLVSSFAGMGVAVQAETSSATQQIVYADFEDWTSSRMLRAYGGTDTSATMASTMINLETEDWALGSQCMSIQLPGTNSASWGFVRYGNNYINDKYVFTTIQNNMVADSSYADTCDAALTFYAKLSDDATDEEGNAITETTVTAGFIANTGSQTAYVAQVSVTSGNWVKYSIPLADLADSTVGGFLENLATCGKTTGGSAAALNHFRFSMSSDSGTLYIDNIALTGSDLKTGATYSFQYDGSTTTTVTTALTDVEDESEVNNPVTLPQIVYATFEEWTSSRMLRAYGGTDTSATMASTMINLETEDAALGSQSMSIQLPGTNSASWGFVRYGNNYINDKYVFTDIQNKMVADSTYADTCDAALTFYAKLSDDATDENGDPVTSTTVTAGFIANTGSQTAYVAQVTVTSGSWVKYSIPLSELADSTVGGFLENLATCGKASGGSAAALNHFRFSMNSDSGTLYIDNIALCGSDLRAGATYSFQYDGSTTTTVTTTLTTSESSGSSSGGTSSGDTSGDTSEDTSSEDTSSKEEGGDEVEATVADGIYPLDGFSGIAVTSTAQSYSITMPRADGLLLNTDAAEASTITINISDGSNYLVLTIPVAEGAGTVSMDFANMTSGNAAFTRLMKNNLTLTISSDNDVALNGMSYYIYSYLLDRTIEIDDTSSEDTSSEDASSEDASSEDASSDTSSDAAADTSSDTSSDAAADTSSDTSSDAAADTSSDTSSDAAADTSSDTSSEDASSETGDTSDDTSSDTGSTTTVLRGDTNLDGQVTAADALLALRHAVESIILTGDAFTAGELSGDGVITASDALLILRIAVGLSA